MNGISIDITEFGVVTPPKIEMICPGGGINLWVLGMLVTMKALGNGTRGAYGLIEHVVPPGRGSPKHIHLYEEESWYLLDGELIWTVRDQELHAKSGSFINLPRLVPHTFVNKFHKPARMLIAFSPAGLEKWYLDVGRPVIDLHQSPPVTTEDVENAMARAMDYGVVFSDHVKELPMRDPFPDPRAQ